MHRNQLRVIVRRLLLGLANTDTLSNAIATAIMVRRRIVFVVVLPSFINFFGFKRFF